MGEITKDDVYIDAERRFNDLERESKKLHEESEKYFQAINGMLDHQIEFSKAVKRIYEPISGRPSDPDSFVIDSNPEGIRACEQYEQLVHELKASLTPELELIKARVVEPTKELMGIIKNVRATATKRDKKQIDLDNAQAKLTKLESKKDKTPQDEAALLERQSKLELADGAYRDYNDGMISGLLELFKLEKEFVSPLFKAFYFMQLNVFYTLHSIMQNMDIGYFNLQLSIEDGFEERRGDAQQRIEAIPIVKFKTASEKRPLSKYQLRFRAVGAGPSRLAIEDSRPSTEDVTASSSSSRTGRRATVNSADQPPPPYESSGDLGRSASTGAKWASAAKTKAAPPPPKPKPGRLSANPTAETVTALFDYDAQAEGDLTIRANDVIEVVTRTSNENEWWVGKLNGQQGQFPGKHQQTLSVKFGFSSS